MDYNVLGVFVTFFKMILRKVFITLMSQRFMKLMNQIYIWCYRIKNVNYWSTNGLVGLGSMSACSSDSNPACGHCRACHSPTFALFPALSIVHPIQIKAPQNRKKNANNYSSYSDMVNALFGPVRNIERFSSSLVPWQDNL